MAADTYEALSYKEPAVYGRGGAYEIVRSATADLDTIVGAAGGSAKPLELNDVIKWFKLPPDVKLMGARVDAEDLDSGTSLTWSLYATDGTTFKYFFVDNTIGQSQGFASTEDASATGVQDAFDTNSALGFVTPDDDYYIGFKCTAAPAGDGGGDNIRVTVKYASALESGESAFRT